MEEFNLTQKGIENFLTSNYATYHIQLQIYYCIGSAILGIITTHMIQMNENSAG
jgi:hypothetical protein